MERRRQAASSSCLSCLEALMLIWPVRRKEARTETAVMPTSGRSIVTSSFLLPPSSSTRLERSHRLSREEFQASRAW